MGTRNLRGVGAVGAALLVGVAALGSAVAAEGDGDEALVVAATDEELVDALLALEDDIPAPLPSSASLAADGVDALLTGSFTSARSTFDALEEDLRALFIDADETPTAVGDAVSDVTRGLLMERQALLVLEETDRADDARPLDVSDARDDDGNAIDADGLYGRTITALDLLIDARELQRIGYSVLEDLPAGVDENGVLAARSAELITYRDQTEIQLRTIASTESEQMLVMVERFDAPIGIAHSLGVTYLCVDREAYFDLEEAPEAERIAGSVEPPDAACAEAAQMAGLSLTEQVATDALLDGVTTAVGTG